MGAAQLCIRLTCGNARVDPGEVCDDGNSRSGDGCPADCSEPCGDGVLDLGEVCDDGNRVDGDGCSVDCSVLDGIALVSPPAVAFAASEGEALPASMTVSLRLMSRGSVQVERAPPWLAVTEESAGPYSAAFKLHVTDTSVAGRRSTSLRFTTDHEGSTAVDTYDLPVAYRVEAADLTMQATATTLDFTATSGGPLPPPRTVDVAFSGAAVAVVSTPPWISASAPDPASSPASFSISINTTDGTGGRTIEGDVVLATVRGNVERRSTVHVRYHLAASLTNVRFVAPYVGGAGRGGTLRVRGAGFRFPGPTVTVGIGDVVLGPVLPDSDTQVSVSYPPLPEGRYPVTLNGSTLAPAGPELVIVPPTPAVYQAIDAHGRWARIVYDAERRTIYGANTLDHQIERVAFAGGAWSKLSPLAMPRLADIAMAPDGRSLIVLCETEISAISLTDGALTSVLLATLIADRFCGSVLHQFAAANNGKMIVTSRLNSCLGYSPMYTFDLLDHSLVPLVASHYTSTYISGVVAGSADGSRIYVGDDGSFHMMVFESLSNTTTRSFPTVNGTEISVSSDAFRVVVNGSVYSRSLTLLGRMPYFHNGAVVSQDSTRAVLYFFDSAGDHLEIYNLNGSPQSDAQYPVLGTVMLPHRANGANGSIYTPVTMAMSPEDRVVFISGDGKLLVVPIP
jgi:cysteine-rich repeat protein